MPRTMSAETEQLLRISSAGTYAALVSELDVERHIGAVLLVACRVQQRALDWLMTDLARVDPSFLPSRSPVWFAVMKAKAAIDRAECGYPEAGAVWSSVPREPPASDDAA